LRVAGAALCFLVPAGAHSPGRRNQLLSANKHEFQIIAKYLDAAVNLLVIIAFDDWQRVSLRRPFCLKINKL
jgi:hypothetical protein